MAEKESVRKMFDNIAARYDLLNHLLSFGIDFLWRKKFVHVLASKKPLLILDVATGTGDLAIDLSSIGQVKITGVDISIKMLEIAKVKVHKRKLTHAISFQQGDAESLPFPDNKFDAVTVAFGVRNFEDLEKGLLEMKRVLKPGGIMQILEFSHPDATPFRQLYSFYSSKVIPILGRIISGSSTAYTYLPESVAAFPSGEDFIRVLEKCGLVNCSLISLTFGVSTIYRGENVS